MNKKASALLYVFIMFFVIIILAALTPTMNFFINTYVVNDTGSNPGLQAIGGITVILVWFIAIAAGIYMLRSQRDKSI